MFSISNPSLTALKKSCNGVVFKAVLLLHYLETQNHSKRQQSETYDGKRATCKYEDASFAHVDVKKTCPPGAVNAHLIKTTLNDVFFRDNNITIVLTKGRTNDRSAETTSDMRTNRNFFPSTNKAEQSSFLSMKSEQRK